MPLELTTTIRRVSSSPKARGGLPPSAAAGRALASIRYITRSTAAEAVEWAGARLDAVAPQGHKAVKAALADAIQERAQEGGKQGRRVADRLIVSLPNDWPPDARREALRRVCAHLAPPGSEVLAMGALHNDKPDNPHMHILAVDGLESVESAKARATTRRRSKSPRSDGRGSGDGRTPQHAQDPRTEARRPALERGRAAQELRREIAAILNTIAQEQDLRGVEWRSFKERGIERTPTTHDGPEKRARTRKQAERPPIDYTPPRPRCLPLALPCGPNSPSSTHQWTRAHHLNPHPFPSPLWTSPRREAAAYA